MLAGIIIGIIVGVYVQDAHDVAGRLATFTDELREKIRKWRESR